MAAAALGALAAFAATPAAAAHVVPIAADDSYSTPAGMTLVVPAPGVLANDTHPNGDRLRAHLATFPSHGRLASTRAPEALPWEGSFAYTPSQGFVGQDSFRYLTIEWFGESEPSNEATVTITVTPDTTDPAITLTTPADGGEYLLGSPVAADYHCDDESGIASCQGPVAAGAAIDTDSVGSRNFTVEAADIFGNLSVLSHDYRVVYDFAGFYSPLLNPPAFNTVKAGAAVPLKFSLGGYQGLDVLVRQPTARQIDCESSGQQGTELIISNAGSGLVYDPLSDQYQLVWKTDKEMSGTCRQLDVELIDGTHHLANFQLR